MTERTAKALIYGSFAAIIIGKAAWDIRTVVKEERAKRQQLSVDSQLDVAAINKAADILCEAIDRGEIHDLKTLQRRTLDEIAFQKIAIREDH